MRIFTHSEILEAHWRDTIVLQGESPEQYAIRMEESRTILCGLQSAYVWVRDEEQIEWLRTEGDLL